MIIGIALIVVGVLGIKYGLAAIITGGTAVAVGLGLKKSS